MPHLIYIMGAYLFYIISIMVHVLVINKKIDYTQINGGRSESFEAQYKISIVSIVILVIGFVIIIVYNVYPPITKTYFSVILMGLMSLYWLLGFVMQLLGTSFERTYLTPVLLLGFVSHVMLLIEYFM